MELWMQALGYYFKTDHSLYLSAYQPLPLVPNTVVRFVVMNVGFILECALHDNQRRDFLQGLRKLLGVTEFNNFFQLDSFETTVG